MQRFRRHLRRHPWESAGLAAAFAGGAILIVLALTNILFDDSGKSSPGIASKDLSSGAPFNTTPAPIDITQPTGVPSPTLGADGTNFAGLNGLLGNGHSLRAGKHAISLRVTSNAPIDFVAYNVPTSPQHYRGVDKNVGKSWSLSSTVFGDPDYAQLFLQAGQSGTPITCTITVDGRVTERRSTQDPYGQIFCQG